MDISKKVTRYAKYLFLFIKNDPKSYKLLIQFYKFLVQNDKVLLILNSPVVKFPQKEYILSEIYKFTQFSEIAQEVKNFLLYLLKEETNLFLFQKIQNKVHNYFIQQEDKKIVIIKSPKLLNSESMRIIEEFLKKKIKNKILIFQNVVKSDILGGVIIEYDGKIIDLSLDRQIRKIEISLFNNKLLVQ